MATKKANNKKKKSSGPVKKASEKKPARKKVPSPKKKAPKESVRKTSPVTTKARKVMKPATAPEPVKEPKTKIVPAPATAPEIVDKPLKVTVKSGPKKPEPKGKYVMEFSVRSSIHILFEFISTPSGLSEWFSDNVHVQTGGFFTFFWDGVGQQAKLIGYKDQEMVRFEWQAKKDGSYFEFRIQTDELTGDVSLIITDFADPAELQTNKLVWSSQVDKLLHLIGSYSG